MLEIDITDFWHKERVLVQLIFKAGLIYINDSSVINLNYFLLHSFDTKAAKGHRWVKQVGKITGKLK